MCSFFSFPVKCCNRAFRCLARGFLFLSNVFSKCSDQSWNLPPAASVVPHQSGQGTAVRLPAAMHPLFHWISYFIFSSFLISSLVLYKCILRQVPEKRFMGVKFSCLKMSLLYPYAWLMVWVEDYRLEVIFHLDLKGIVLLTFAPIEKSTPFWCLFLCNLITSGNYWDLLLSPQYSKISVTFVGMWIISLFIFATFSACSLNLKIRSLQFWECFMLFLR